MYSQKVPQRTKVAFKDKRKVGRMFQTISRLKWNTSNLLSRVESFHTKSHPDLGLFSPL